MSNGTNEGDGSKDGKGSPAEKDREEIARMNLSGTEYVDFASF
ncbi:MAG: hypothetical protein ACREN8_12580 [Candidatus Dormibacteraceae bacterium]